MAFCIQFNYIQFISRLFRIPSLIALFLGEFFCARAKELLGTIDEPSLIYKRIDERSFWTSGGI
jgi:hypothetical protein